MTEKELYTLWCKNAKDDPDLCTELESIKDDNDAIVDRFYRDLEFGTGGLRGVIGAGTNRMNIYTVRRATQGFADYLNQEYTNPQCCYFLRQPYQERCFLKGCCRGSCC